MKLTVEMNFVPALLTQIRLKTFNPPGGEPKALDKELFLCYNLKQVL